MASQTHDVGRVTVSEWPRIRSLQVVVVNTAARDGRSMSLFAGKLSNTTICGPSNKHAVRCLRSYSSSLPKAHGATFLPAAIVVQQSTKRLFPVPGVGASTTKSGVVP